MCGLKIIVSNIRGVNFARLPEFSRGGLADNIITPRKYIFYSQTIGVTDRRQHVGKFNIIAIHCTIIRQTSGTITPRHGENNNRRNE